MIDDCISVRAHRMLAWAGDILGIDAGHRNDWRFDSAQKDVIRTLNDIRVGGQFRCITLRFAWIGGNTKCNIRLILCIQTLQETVPVFPSI